LCGKGAVIDASSDAISEVDGSLVVGARALAMRISAKDVEES
jgi:hypothetical protein